MQDNNVNTGNNGEIDVSHQDSIEIDLICLRLKVSILHAVVEDLLSHQYSSTQAGFEQVVHFFVSMVQVLEKITEEEWQYAPSVLEEVRETMMSPHSWVQAKCWNTITPQRVRIIPTGSLATKYPPLTIQELLDREPKTPTQDCLVEPPSLAQNYLEWFARPFLEEQFGKLKAAHTALSESRS